MKFEKNLAIIGLGKMGNALIGSLIKSQVIDPKQIFGTDFHKETAQKIKEKYLIYSDTDNPKAVSKSDIIILAVKPQMITPIISEILPELNEDKILLSIAAGITTGFIEKKLNKSVPVIRVMPNAAAFVNEAMTVLYPGKYAKKEDLDIASKIFKAVGQVEVVYEEDLMDAVTGVSGSGPAYCYMVIESLIDGGVRMGLPRELARKLAAQTILGGARMVLETGIHPAILKDQVSTPAGTTVDGLMELEDGGVRVAFIKAVESATQKSRQLSK